MHLGAVTACPSTIMLGTMDSGYENESTTIYLDDYNNQVTIGIQNPGAVNHRLHISFNGKTLFLFLNDGSSSYIFHSLCIQPRYNLPLFLSALMNRNIRVECGPAILLPVAEVVSGGTGESTGLSDSGLTAIIVVMVNLVLLLVAVAMYCIYKW